MPVVEKVEKPNHPSSVVMLRYHRADSILLNCVRNLSYVCFPELVESDVVRKTFVMVTEMTLV